MEIKELSQLKKVKDGAIWKDIYFSLQSVDLQDGGNSAIVVWGENEKTVKGKDLVFKLLHDNLTKNYTYEEIYNELVKVNVDISLDSIKPYCNDLVKQNKIFKKDASEVRTGKQKAKLQVYFANKAAF